MIRVSPGIIRVARMVNINDCEPGNLSRAIEYADSEPATRHTSIVETLTAKLFAIARGNILASLGTE